MPNSIEVQFPIGAVDIRVSSTGRRSLLYRAGGGFTNAIKSSENLAQYLPYVVADTLFLDLVTFISAFDLSLSPCSLNVGICI